MPGCRTQSGCVGSCSGKCLGTPRVWLVYPPFEAFLLISLDAFVCSRVEFLLVLCVDSSRVICVILAGRPRCSNQAGLAVIFVGLTLCSERTFDFLREYVKCLPYLYKVCRSVRVCVFVMCAPGMFSVYSVCARPFLNVRQLDWGFWSWTNVPARARLGVRFSGVKVLFLLFTFFYAYK